VIVWAREGDAAACAAELEARFPAERVLLLRATASGTERAS
jgi:hypothetical protein